MKLGDEIRAFRIKLYLSQTEFATALGLAQPTICNIERNTRMPSMRIIQAILALSKKKKVPINIQQGLAG